MSHWWPGRHRACSSDVAMVDALAKALLVMSIIFVARALFCLFADRGMTTDLSVMSIVGLLLSSCSLAGALLYAMAARIGRPLAFALLFVPFTFINGLYALEAQYLIFNVGRHFPLADARLAAIDAHLGFDWRAYFLLLSGNATINQVLTLAYTSITWQVLALHLALAVVLAGHRCAQLHIALGVLFTLTCAVGLVMPAIGAYHFHGITPDLHAGARIIFTDATTAPIEWLRSGPLTGPMPPFPDLRVITFPSLHAGVAAILIAGWWRFARLRWIMLPLNVLMLLATPLHGSHYLADVLVGLCLGVLSILIAGRIVSPGRVEASQAGRVPSPHPVPAGTPVAHASTVPSDIR